VVHLNLTGLWSGQDGIVGVMTGCGVQTPVSARDFIFSALLEWPGTHLPSFQWVLGGCVLCFKFGINHPPLSSAKVKDEWSYTFAHLCASDGILWGDLYLYLTGPTEQACCNSLAHLQKFEKQLLASFCPSVGMEHFCPPPPPVSRFS
jgi:hypothetical protein